MRLLVVTFLLIASSARADEPSGFVPLFNGKDLTGWELKQSKGEIKDCWSVKDGILTCKAGTGWIGTDKQYANFILRVEWRVQEGGNSGVFLRVPGVVEGKSPSMTGMEIQVLDDNSAKYKGKLKPYQFSGSIYTFVPCAKPVYKGVNTWNSFEITAKGEKVTVVYNGEKVAEADMTTPEFAKRPLKGFIGLQNHGSAVEFRKVEIKVLD
jgi:3-keto-disaccharide hydrolase